MSAYGGSKAMARSLGGWGRPLSGGARGHTTLGPKGVSSVLGRGVTPRFAAAIVAYSMGLSAPIAKRGDLSIHPTFVGHPILREADAMA